MDEQFGRFRVLLASDRKRRDDLRGHLEQQSILPEFEWHGEDRLALYNGWCRLLVAGYWPRRHGLRWQHGWLSLRAEPERVSGMEHESEWGRLLLSCHSPIRGDLRRLR